VGGEKGEGLISTSLTFPHDVVTLIRSVINIEGIKMPTIGIEAIHVLCRCNFRKPIRSSTGAELFDRVILTLCCVAAVSLTRFRHARLLLIGSVCLSKLQCFVRIDSVRLRHDAHIE
jgi:hypothetical protein